MEKTASAFEVRRSFGRILQEVAAKGDRVVVERHGEAVAAVVPIDVYNQWKRSRSEFFERMRRASEQAALAPEEADQLAADAHQSRGVTPPTAPTRSTGRPNDALTWANRPIRCQRHARHPNSGSSLRPRD